MSRIKAIFRILPGQAIALFPEVPADPDGKFCVAYERPSGRKARGQQISADVAAILSATTPAPLKRLAHGVEPLPGDGQDLFNELLDLGYSLSVVGKIDVAKAVEARRTRLAKLN